MVDGIPEDNHIAALDGLEAVHKLVDEDALLIAQKRRHARAFHLHRLVQKYDDHQRQAQRHGQIARPTAQLAPQLRQRRTRFGRRLRGWIGDLEHSSSVLLYHADASGPRAVRRYASRKSRKQSLDAAQGSEVTRK